MVVVVECRDAELDWESPCGRADERPVRMRQFGHVFTGSGEAHWVGQPCELITTTSADQTVHLIALACGCQAEVPASALEPVPRRARSSEM